MLRCVHKAKVTKGRFRATGRLPLARRWYVNTSWIGSGIDPQPNTKLNIIKSIFIVQFKSDELYITLQWLYNERDGVSNHQPHDCFLDCLFRRRSKKTPKPRVTGLFEGNSPATGEFPAQRASNAENDSIWWRHHEFDQVYLEANTRVSESWWKRTSYISSLWN